MANLIRISRDNKYEINQKKTNYLNPDFVYVPYKKGFELNIKTKEKVLKESILLSKDGKNIYSPISGTVLGAQEQLINKEKVYSIVIENDFKEKVEKITPANKQINNYSKEEFNKLIMQYNALNKKIDGNIILISGIDFEIYEATLKHIISKYSTELLETIDAIYDIFKCNKCYFAINNNDSEIIEKLIYQIGTYPNIELKLMPDLYPVGHKDILIEELNLKNTNNIIYLTVEDIIAIYNVLRKKRPITEKLVTITGDAIDKGKVINVKLGTALKDILNNNFKIINKDYKIVVNGLLSGYEVDSEFIVITKDIRSIFINTSNIDEEKDCINCGLCHIKCPVGCDPRKNFKTEKCINCGICTYICPSNKNFKTKRDNNE